ncbi:MAG: diacylglycerol kinase family lipid kinase [Nanoarchaeota archaeon]|nr:diacylglycerol kinase family lipid kinase [Nanoarchaeota archaeon]
MKRLKLIVNPSSACGKKLIALNTILKTLNKNGFEVSIHISKDFKDLYHTARKASKRYKTVVAMGGDGTVNHIANGLAKSRCNLGIIPVGTANCFASEFNIPSNPVKACEIIIKGKTRQIDLGMINRHYFIGFASLGFDAGIVHDFYKSQDIKNLSGGKAELVVPLYIMYGIKKFIETKPVKMVLKIDGKRVPGGYWVVIGNISRYPGDWRLFPKSKVDDGLLDINVVKSADLINTIRCVFTTKKGKHLDMPDLDYHQAKEVIIKSARPVRMQADGEYIGTTPAKIKVVPKALNLIVP